MIFMEKNDKNMRFSWDFLQDILEDDDYNLQTKFGVRITSNIFKINLILKSLNYTTTPPPTTQLWSLPYPRGKL